MQYIEVEYNQELRPLEAVLSRVKQPGDFFVCGTVEMPMPSVEVEGAGTLSFPVPDAQIAAIVRRAKRAPYGRGQETIVDTSVRKVWQVAPDKVKLGGKSWAANFETILSKVKAGLGCEDASVSAELYKVLVYDRGGFFLAHRDTEKADGMFGTLVVTLPSTYRGGALRIRHAGREVTVDTNTVDPSELSYVAFYADCEHEALPVREGNRICLVYNLVQKQSKTRHRILKAPEYESQITEAAAILDRFLRAPDAPAKIAWLLDHQYSPAGLSFSALKGADAAKARVLVQAAARAQCAAHLGVVHIGESGAAEPEDDYFYGSRRNRYRNYHDEHEEDDDEDASFTVATVDDTWQYVDEWRDTDDRVVELGRIPITGGELLPAGALDREPPDEKRLTEASGNEGATYERSYHRAALVLWRQSRSVDVLLQAGVVAALPYLKQLAARGKRAQPEAISVAERILEAWPGHEHRWDGYSTFREWPGPADRTGMIVALTKLNAPALLERFLREVITSSYDGSEKAALLASVSALGDAHAAAVLSGLVSARMPERPNECSELLLALSENPSLCFPEAAEAAVAALDFIGTHDKGTETLDWEPEEPQRPLDPQFLENLLRALQRFKGGTPCGTAAEKIASRPEIYSPVTLVVPAIERICAGRGQQTAAVDSSVRHLWTSAAEFLLQCSEIPPKPPLDWRLNIELSCSCPDCRELQTFARHLAERVHRFRVRKERRRHLHNMIDRHRLDMTHVTERAGSPQTLVCKKDRRTFDRRMKQYQDEIAAMLRLVRLAPKAGGAALSKRMEVAGKRAADLKQRAAPATE
jgi:2OG-Fe(II) oxygenase superfamily